jgi:hypothetical protein
MKHLVTFVHFQTVLGYIYTYDMIFITLFLKSNMNYI